MTSPLLLPFHVLEFTSLLLSSSGPFFLFFRAQKSFASLILSPKSFFLRKIQSGLGLGLGLGLGQLPSRVPSLVDASL